MDKRALLHYNSEIMAKWALKMAEEGDQVLFAICISDMHNQKLFSVNAPGLTPEKIAEQLENCAKKLREKKSPIQGLGLIRGV